MAQILRISSSYTPPSPEGFISPMTWGIENNVNERFSMAGIPAGNIAFARDTFTFNYPSAPSALLQEFRAYYGPTMSAFECHFHSGHIPARHGCGLKMPGDASGRPLEKEREISPAINMRRFSKLVTRLLFRE